MSSRLERKYSAGVTTPMLTSSSLMGISQAQWLRFW